MINVYAVLYRACICGLPLRDFNVPLYDSGRVILCPGCVGRRPNELSLREPPEIFIGNHHVPRVTVVRAVG